eukprot:scaffold64201_cov58-Phaeocystis_antarctica.AAC.1
MGRDVIVIVHAYGGLPKKFWYPALCKHFDADATVVVPYMPGGTAPVVGEWLSHLQTTVQKATTHLVRPRQRAAPGGAGEARREEMRHTRARLGRGKEHRCSDRVGACVPWERERERERETPRTA